MFEIGKLYWYSSGSGILEMQLPGECLAEIARSGDNMPAVETWLSLEPVRSQLIAFDPADIRDELQGYGAWDNAELSDDESNLKRFLWCAAHSAAEEIRSGEYQE
jgi:hypothetical protein